MTTTQPKEVKEHKLLMAVTSITEQLRRDLDITRDEYALCKYAHYRQADPRMIKAGWCTDEKDDVAFFVGISRQSLRPMLLRMELKGLIEVSGVKGWFRATSKWIDLELAGKETLHKEFEEKRNARKETFHGHGKKLSTETEFGGKKLSEVYKLDISKKEEIEEEINTPQAAFITTHSPTKVENVEVVIVEGQTITLEEKTLEPISPAAKKPRTPKTAGNSTAAVCAEIKTPEVLDFFHSIHAAWAEWIDYKRRERKGTYKSAKSEAATITELANEVNCDPEAARAAIQRSIAKTYTGICPDKNWKSSTPPPRYSLEDRPQAHTPEQMKEELSRFYNANSALLSEAQKTAETNYTGDRLRSIVIDFCSNQVARRREGETFGQHHAALGLWLKRQKEFDTAKNPATTQHTAGPQPQAPLRSAAPVNYSQTGPVLRAEKAE
jgi:DNA-binding PadR family transcriptional regulator